MIPAHSLSSIAKVTDQTLGSLVVTKREPVFEIGLAVPGMPSTRPRTRNVSVRTEQWSKLVGILFCVPGRKIAKDEVLPNLEYFHHRSGRFVDFFCVGYGAYWPQGNESEEPQIVATVNGTKWLFSAQRFNSCRKEVEQVSRWKYSGEAELLLLAARKKPGEIATLDFSTAITCNLEQMSKDEAFTSVGAFFEKIFRFGEHFQGEDPVWQLSDKMGLSVGANALLESILTMLPDSVRKGYKATKHFVIRDIGK